MSNTWTKTLALVTMFCMFLTADVYAGPGKPQKMGFFAKIGSAIKNASQKAAAAVKNAAQKTAAGIKNVAQKTATGIKNAAKKTGMAIKTAGAKVVNAGMDTGVWAKQKLFGKKNKVWVCGHYDKNGKWTKGHWRKLNAAKPAGGNTADQGNYADQSSSGDQGGAAEANTDAGMSGDGNSYEESSNESATETGSEVANEGEAGDMPVAGEDPVLPEMPGDNNNNQAQEAEQTSQESEQTSQESEQATQSGDADQGKEFSYDNEVSMRTMGMLMDDIVKQSQSINTFKKSAKANISYSVEVQDDINTTYESREDDASLLSRIVVWDVRTNNGKAGKYFNFFVNRMNRIAPKNREMVKDVVDQIRAGIVHEANNAASEEEKAVFNQRLSDLSKF